MAKHPALDVPARSPSDNRPYGHRAASAVNDRLQGTGYGVSYRRYLRDGYTRARPYNLYTPTGVVSFSTPEAALAGALARIAAAQK